MYDRYHRYKIAEASVSAIASVVAASASEVSVVSVKYRGIGQVSVVLADSDTYQYLAPMHTIFISVAQYHDPYYRYNTIGPYFENGIRKLST